MLPTSLATNIFSLGWNQHPSLWSTLIGLEGACADNCPWTLSLRERSVAWQREGPELDYCASRIQLLFKCQILVLQLHVLLKFAFLYFSRSVRERRPSIESCNFCIAGRTGAVARFCFLRYCSSSARYCLIPQRYQIVPHRWSWVVVLDQWGDTQRVCARPSHIA